MDGQNGIEDMASQLDVEDVVSKPVGVQSIHSHLHRVDGGEVAAFALPCQYPPQRKSVVDFKLFQ